MEKPLVSNPEDGKDLVRTCNANGVTLGVAYHLRWHNGHRKLIKRIHNGALGGAFAYKSPLDVSSGRRLQLESSQRSWKVAGSG